MRRALGVVAPWPSEGRSNLGGRSRVRVGTHRAQYKLWSKLDLRTSFSEELGPERVLRSIMKAHK